LTLGAITGSAQCLHVNTSGLVSGTGSDCGSGGGGTSPGGTSGQIQYNNAGVFGGLTIGPTLVNNSGTLNTSGTVVAGTTQTVTSTQWNAGTTFRVTTSGQTLTLPVSSTLSVNGGLAIPTIGQTVTLAPNAADAINGGTAGASITIASGLTAYVTTDGAGNIYASPISGGSASTGANPTATASDTAVNGSATTFMRSDAAPAVQKASSSQFGIVKVDGTSITATGGVISAVTGGSGTVTTSGTPASGNLAKFSGSTVVTNGDLSGDCTTSGTLAVTCANEAKLNVANAWTATQTFAGVLGGADTQSGTTYTLVASDCGKTVVFTSASAVTVTIPASIVPASGTACAIAILQSGAGQVAVNGTAVSAATLVSAHSYTKTFGQNAMIGLTLTTISATATAILSGDGA
jgi:hypothetical protein